MAFVLLRKPLEFGVAFLSFLLDLTERFDLKQFSGRKEPKLDARLE